MATNNVNIEILDGALGTLPPDVDAVHCVIGCATGGDNLTPLETASVNTVVDTFTSGPLVEAAAFTIAQTGGKTICIKVPTDAAGVAGDVTFVGTGTSVITVTGDGLDYYQILFLVVAGGTIGVAGIKFKVSLDNGRTYNATTALGTANTYAIPGTGLTLNFAAGDLDVDDRASCEVSQPEWLIADVVLAIQALEAMTAGCRLIHIVGPMSKSNADTVNTALAALQVGFKYTRCIVEARDADHEEEETEAEWMTAIETDYASFESELMVVASDYDNVTSPISARKQRRSLAWPAITRAVAKAVQVDLGRVRDGSLVGTSMGPDPVEWDTYIYHDERINPGLDEARFMTARTLIGRPGVYIMNPNIMSSAGSDFRYLQHGRVIDKACDIVRNSLLDNLSNDVLVNADGTIQEGEAVAIENAVQRALFAGLISTGNATATSVTVSREDNILSSEVINVAVRVRPKGYLKTINVTLGFENPNLLAA